MTNFLIGFACFNYFPGILLWVAIAEMTGYPVHVYVIIIQSAIVIAVVIHKTSERKSKNGKHHDNPPFDRIRKGNG